MGSATFLALVGGCKNDNKTAPGTSESPSTTLDCSTPIDEASKTLRRNLQYKKEAVDPAKKCTACAQYEPGKYKDCGGCKLIPGPISPNGGCLSFAPKEAGAAPATSG
ncbi:MAG: hypothetical protein U0270_11450 [Labilithrix sp.]